MRVPFGTVRFKARVRVSSRVRVKGNPNHQLSLSLSLGLSRTLILSLTLGLILSRTSRAARRAQAEGGRPCRRRVRGLPPLVAMLVGLQALRLLQATRLLQGLQPALVTVRARV